MTPLPYSSSAMLKYLVSAILMSSLVVTAHAADDYDLEVVITKKAPVSQHEVAFVPFGGDTSLSKTILADLRSTPLKVTTNNLVHKPHSVNDLSGTLPAWQQLGIPYLVVGNTLSNKGATEVSFQVVDLTTSPVTIKGGRPSGDKISGTDKNAIAHKAANRIYELVTGKKADFDASILYIEEEQGDEGKISTLKMMNADGTNVRAISAPIVGSIFSPTVSRDGKYAAYSVQLKNSRANLFLHNLSNHGVRRLVDLKGDNLSPSFSPDGRQVLFQSTYDGDADIYQVNVADGHIQKVLDLPYDQTQPSFAIEGDGKSFVFTSDHASPNNPSIYRAAFSGDITRLSQGRDAANPSYSPDGSKIGYLYGSSAAVMSGSGSSIANFGNTAIDEAPRFSPTGERVVYSQGTGKSTIVIRSLAGGNTITKRADGIVRSPVWVPSTN